MGSPALGEISLETPPCPGQVVVRTSTPPHLTPPHSLHLTPCTSLPPSLLPAAECLVVAGGLRSPGSNLAVLASGQEWRPGTPESRPGVDRGHLANHVHMLNEVKGGNPKKGKKKNK